MEKLIIFYEDAKQSCREFAQSLEKYENVECRKASEYKDQGLFFSRNCRTGLVFESQNGKIPDVISQIIWRVVAEKKESHMIYVTGGSRELLALRRAKENIQTRGYTAKYIYTGYILEKCHMDKNSAAEFIMDSLNNDRENVPAEETANPSRRAIRKQLWQERKEYRKYKKRKQDKM